jgi:hypothetical protein
LHIQGDALEAIANGRPTDGAPWELLIAHPPCTYLSSSGMHWTVRGLRDPALTERALEFVSALLASNVPHIALENPVGCISSRIRKPDQIIQPWQFGDDASKATCLWLENLPKLKSAGIHPPREWQVVRGAFEMAECPDCGEPYCEQHKEHYADCECIGPTDDCVTFKTIGGVLFGTRCYPPKKPVWGNQTANGQNKLGPSPERAALRAVTYKGIAAAMAEQWGDYVAALEGLQ